MTKERAAQIAAEAVQRGGFTHAAALAVETLCFMPEVREMCEVNRCGKFGTCWTCPPGCGTLEEIARRASAFEHGVLVQTVGTLEDDFDYEGIEAAGKRHDDAFAAFGTALVGRFGRILPMGMGSCGLCAECTYPDAPCRFPDRAFPSMEAYGLLVNDVCVKNDLGYYYGPRTIAYTSCYLLDDEIPGN